MSLLLLVSIAAILAAIKFYKWATQYHDYFEKSGMKHVKPKFLLGTTGDLMSNKCRPDVFFKQIYNTFPNEK